MKIWRSLKYGGNFLGIALGGILSAYSVQGFIVHAGLGGGGLGGIALLLFYTLGLPIGLITLLLNIPLFFLGWREVSREFVLKTIIGLVIYSLALDLFKGTRPLPFDDIFLGALYGGVLGGIGSGLVFRLGGSLGGLDIIAKVIQRRLGWAMGTTMLLINAFIILISWAILGPKIALYTLVSIFTFSRTVDVIQGGIPAKAVTIISNHSDTLVNRIHNEVGRGATFLKGRGSFSEQEKNVIICVVSMSEIGHLKRIIREEDSHAFLIIQNASEVIGQRWANE
ncbi:YitT family protein [Desulfitobacterium sp.]|uniref:YitT family protein n=1 Tax=Desulfitobacterium sp. TaxID=49981 RepID=UPI002C4B5D29|nr:YitT family protein [Desulfitobacterium sp.]HVJ48549.1 YitT family protein [Desulfitobacterium sp.]